MFKLKHLPLKGFGLWRWMIVLIGLLLLLDLVAFLVAEGLWFAGVNYFQVFSVRLRSQGGLGLFVFIGSLGFLLSNLALARQYAWTPPNLEAAVATNRPFLPGRMGLSLLLLLALLMSLMVGVMLVYHGEIAASHWHPNFNIYSASTAIPLQFRPQSVWSVGQYLYSHLWQFGLVVGLAIALLLFSQVVLSAIALLMSLGFGLVLSEHWAQVLPFFYPTSFDLQDPLFSQDIGFYIFQLPLWELLEFWFVGLLALTFLSVTLTYLLSGNSLAQGRFPGFSAAQRRHLYGVGGGVMLTVALGYWLARFELLYSRLGVNYGASYADVVVQLPAYLILSVLALAIALYMLWRTCFWQHRSSTARYSVPAAAKKGAIAEIQRPTSLRGSGIPTASPQLTEARVHPIPPKLRVLMTILVLYLFGALMGGFVIPEAVQRLIVQPNELALETPFLERTIALTRRAFNLEVINVENFDPQPDLTYDDILDNELTINNVRVWDSRPILATNRQLQRIRPYYEFPDADIDRYTLLTEDGGSELRQVMIAARELDYDSVPAEAQTWINRHLIYTHGYGFTLSPVNTAGEGGLPDYFIRGIEQIPSSPLIRDSIPIGQPRIYYGELTDTYVLTQTGMPELDFASGDENVYNVYDGRGGVRIGSPWRRFLFAWYLRDWRILLTDNFTPDTRVLFRRNIGQRVRAIAPFLRFDRDPYLVAADTGDEVSFLYWIIDAYTTSDRYPYSDPLENDFNYIRNSVKVVVDAYHGNMWFYVADPTDPIIQTWSRILPGMLQPLSAMPPELFAHIRYPQDFYLTQSQQLMIYHMTDPREFYNREDKWRAPNEIYGNEEQLVEPYYLIMRLPTGAGEEFILLRPYTPAFRNNMIAWLAARSDGAQYGNMLLYTFPKQELVFGPEQIEARINQDPVISQQISLWNRQGSRAVQGNLLVIPIEQSLLYVEPLYLEAEQTSLPILARVIVVYENRIAMAETLELSLQAIFQPETLEQTTPAIIREFEDETLPAAE